MWVSGAGGGWARRLTRAIERSPKPGFRKRGGRGGGPALRILDDDLVARRSRSSRIRAADRRRVRSMALALPWFLLATAAAALAALLLFTVAEVGV